MNRRLHLASAALAFAGAALLASCGSLPPDNSAPGQADASSTSRDRSWIMPDAKRSVLLYISDDTGTVSVLSYPKGKRVGALTGFEETHGLCSDTKGHVFVVDSKAQQIVEFAHGGTSPIATLSDAGNYPNGCAIDPNSGNLAVSGGYPHYASGNVAVYAAAQGAPTVYTDFNAIFAYCTYDGTGDVFATGTDGSQAWLSELPAGGASLVDIGIYGSINPSPAIQWDGTYLAIESPSGDPLGPATVYQVEISGSSAKIVNTIKLYTKKNKNPPRATQFWINAGKIVNPESAHNLIGLWPYPVGGEATRTIPFRAPGSLLGLTISIP